jgi:hypothetical protein
MPEILSRLQAALTDLEANSRVERLPDVTQSAFRLGRAALKGAAGLRALVPDCIVPEDSPWIGGRREQARLATWFVARGNSPARLRSGVSRGQQRRGRKWG